MGNAGLIEPPNELNDFYKCTCRDAVLQLQALSCSWRSSVLLTIRGTEEQNLEHSTRDLHMQGGCPVRLQDRK